RPEYADDWPAIVADFTEGTRGEVGNLFFDWSRSLDDPNEWVLVEGFRDGEAGANHVGSDHFRAAVAMLPDHVSAAPKIISETIDAAGWNEMGEVRPRQA
ncbi:MAG: putative quinol monooxygenase, partial [Janthinobacterium lividum]